MLRILLFLAVVIDQAYTAESYESVKQEIENFLIYGKREILKHGGVNHVYFPWAAINLSKRGK